jgi:hypothetical protein
VARADDVGNGVPHGYRWEAAGFATWPAAQGLA